VTAESLERARQELERTPIRAPASRTRSKGVLARKSVLPASPPFRLPPRCAHQGAALTEPTAKACCHELQGGEEGHFKEAKSDPDRACRASPRWPPKVRTGMVACARCGRLINPDEAWDMGHDDENRSVHIGPEHVRCKRATLDVGEGAR